MIKGPARKLTIYVDEADKMHGKPVYEKLLELFFRKKLAGASVFRGVAGYGSRGKMHTAKILELSTDLPVRIDVVDTREMIEAVLPEVTALVTKGLVEVSETQVIKCGGSTE